MGSSYEEVSHILNINGIDASNPSKYQHVVNGFISPKNLAHHSGSRLWIPLRSNILKSALPCVAFFVVYSLNDTLRFLPGISDLNCVNFHNISALDYRIFLGHPPHVFFSSHHNPLLDIASALPYLLHYTIPFLFPLFLFLVKMDKKIPHFFQILSLAMWSHYTIWFLFPTAPPWLADKLENIKSLTSSSTERLNPEIANSLQREGCAFARLDADTGLNFFKRIFDGNPVPFASFPSGHVAWPVCMVLVADWNRRVKTLLLLYIGWVAWSTMYSCHHYFSDILAAIVVVSAMNVIRVKYQSRHTSLVSGQP